MIVPLLLYSLVTIHTTKAASPAPIVFLIQSQPGVFHERIAERTKTSILSQWKKYVPKHVMDPPKIILTAEVEESIAYSGWTIFPLLEIMNIQLEAESAVEWIALLNENTDVDLRNLNEAVEKYKLKPVEDPIFLGRSLKDEDSTIVHHFDSFERSGVLFPDLESGIFLSRKLVLDLVEKLKGDEMSTNSLFPFDFNIDASYEFAKFLYDNGEGVSLTHLDEICAKKSSSIKCITSIRQDFSCAKLADQQKMKDVLQDSFIAVKTCSQFHESRLSVVKKTWSPLIPNIEFFSEVADDKIPTTHLEYTINTERGHCNKTIAILQHFLTLPSEPKFLVLVDDDTILSAARLAQLLACYQEEDSPFILGQRYGYQVAAMRGYNYITGGGGIIFSRSAVEEIASCACPAPDTPDDMHLGRCAKYANIPLLHSGRMFQARPPDYPSSMLAYRRPISFHKHWEIDPIKVYRDYFQSSDAKLEGVKEEL